MVLFFVVSRSKLNVRSIPIEINTGFKLVKFGDTLLNSFSADVATFSSRPKVKTYKAVF